MPNECSPTSSARAISSSRCAMRSGGPSLRPEAGSVTAETKLSIPRCTPRVNQQRRPARSLPHDLAGVEQVERVEGGLDRHLHRLDLGAELGAHAGSLEQADAVLAGD